MLALGVMIGARAGSVVGVGTGAVAGIGRGGTGVSPMLVSSGVGVFGIKIVFLTSLRPLTVPAFLVDIACCISLIGVHYIVGQWCSLTARSVLATFAKAASASPSSSWIGAFRISTLNCGVLASLALRES
jgi:hypothetical protein